jgi:DNA-binding response OmpR family regulator
MDVQMPVMDGVEATMIIRDKISKTLPVIALTALALKGDESKFRAAGMNDYLSKPFEENQLLHIISQWLGNETSLLNKKIVMQKTETETLYDLSKLQEIAKGDQPFVDKMVNMFIEQGPASVKEILDAYEIKDLAKVNQVAHRMKTSIHNMGIASLKNEISEIELLAQHNESSERLDSLISSLETVINEVIIQLKDSKN